MVWPAICSRDLKSKIFVATSTINSKLYIDECLPNVPAWFWPSLASQYYSEPIQDWNKENNVDVAP